MNIQVRVRLLMGTKAPVTPGICYRPSCGKVVFLEILEIVQKALIVISSECLVYIVGCNSYGAKGVAPHATTHARATGFTYHGSNHVYLFEQVVVTLIRVIVPVYPLTGYG
ncbi:hypothetical protein ES703_81149 [subsurface metagenome]